LRRQEGGQHRPVKGGQFIRFLQSAAKELEDILAELKGDKISIDKLAEKSKEQRNLLHFVSQK